MNHFVYKLVPPRSTFPADVSDSEAAAMEAHAEYWQRLLAGGSVVVYGPVDDPSGVWGLGVVEAETEAEVRALGIEDPAVTSGTATFEVYPTLFAQLRRS